MLEKLKEFGESAKSILLYLVTPLAFIVGYIWYLINKNRDLRSELEEKKGSEKEEELKGEQSRIDSSASDVFKLYTELRDDYLSASDSSVRPSPKSPGGSDKDSR